MTREGESPRAIVTPLVTGLLLMLGCGGNGQIQEPPDPPLDISGVWIGTETLENRSGAGCHPAVQPGTRTGDMFNVTQQAGQIVILQLQNCAVCRFTGAVSASGAFLASGTIPPDGQVRVEGQVSGNSMTATKRPIGVDCSSLAEYELTRR